MLAWFLRLLGLSRGITDHLEQASFAFQRPAVFWLGLLALVPLGYYIFIRQRDRLVTASPALRWLLTACRIVILVLLVFILAGPYLRIDHTLEKRPIVAVLLDESQSMWLPAGPFTSDETVAGLARAAGLLGSDEAVDDKLREEINEMGRLPLACKVLETCRDPLVRGLAERFDLRLFGVGDKLRLKEMPQGAEGFPEPSPPGAARSAIGAGIVAVMEEAAGRPVAGIILLSDGQNTGSVPLAEAAESAAQAGIPVFSVPVGSSEHVPDVAIADVFAPSEVALGDSPGVSVTIESHGLDGRPVKVTLTEGDETLDTKDLVLRGSEQQQIELSFEAKRPGTHALSVDVTPLDEERIRQNNHDAVFIDVNDKKLKLLYVEGSPRWDFRFIKNGVRRDRGLEPSVFLEVEQRAGNTEEGVALPDTADDWAKYRTVMLGDCSSETLNSQRLETLNTAVRDKGLGLIILAGPNFMPHAYEGTPLVDLLPVRVRRGVAGYDAPAHSPFRLEIAPAGVGHSALHLYDEPARNSATWAEMPPYFWCAATVRPAVGATVLATNPTISDQFGKMPILAHHFAGKGKVLFVGTDSTWLWRQNVGDRFFYKFWGQSIRFVASPDEAERQTGSLEVKPARSQPGEPISIDLRALDVSGQPLAAEQCALTVVGPAGTETLTLDADSVTLGRFTGQFLPQSPGSYLLRFDPGTGQPPISTEVRVMMAAEELRKTHVDRPALGLLASHTRGELIELPGLASLAAKLEGEPKTLMLHREESVWDNWFTLAVLLFIYSIDVGLRRLRGLS